jgi:hypothetical protein
MSKWPQITMRFIFGGALAKCVAELAGALTYTYLQASLPFYGRYLCRRREHALDFA